MQIGSHAACAHPTPPNEPELAPHGDFPLAELRALAAAKGVETGYVDVHGRTHDIPAETLKALLWAVGVNVDAPRAVSKEPARTHAAGWDRPLPPVFVVGQSEQKTLAVVLPADSDRVDWRVMLEDGRIIEGSADFSALPLQDRRRLGGALMERRSLNLAGDFPNGYHLLSLATGCEVCDFIVTPGTCWIPPKRPDGRRLWGVAVHLPLLRSESNWGIGDFTDLTRLVQHAAYAGVDVVGISPLHAGFPDRPEEASPYAPSSRLLLNILFIDVSAIRGFAQSRAARDLTCATEFQKKLRECRASPIVDYTTVTQLKMTVLRLLYKEASEDEASETWHQFQTFLSAQDEALTCGCLFQTLREHFGQSDTAGADWRLWPEEFQDPESEAVERFALGHAEEVQFYAWLQWCAATQLAVAEDAARGMAVGLYRDLAVGVSAAGAESWGNQLVTLRSVSLGAPPDSVNTAGQNWGIVPFDPSQLREEGYRSFIALLRANMRHAGALRIDHVMGLQKLWCIPEGSDASEGGYLQCNLPELLGIVALESSRHRCLIVGEDLGTVPEGLRERMASARMLSYRVLHFERGEGERFTKAESYPELAVAVAGNHDLPTVRGWLEGRDLQLHAAHCDTTESLASGMSRRGHEVTLLRSVLRDQKLEEAACDLASYSETIEAVHQFLGRTPCMLALVQLDDWVGETDPVNVPGTTSQYPNWRRKLSLNLEDLLKLPQWTSFGVEVRV